MGVKGWSFQTNFINLTAKYGKILFTCVLTFKLWKYQNSVSKPSIRHFACIWVEKTLSGWRNLLEEGENSFLIKRTKDFLRPLSTSFSVLSRHHNSMRLKVQVGLALSDCANNTRQRHMSNYVASFFCGKDGMPERRNIMGLNGMASQAKR